ncbi:MAG TPA: hypothetical protein VMV94_19465 [Phycisphaerae bacterium]|nr:hypothetical protein [Phycisphaerae bacterium]
MRLATILTVSTLSILGPLASTMCPAQTINHSHINGVGSLPQTTMDAIGLQKWLFTHASVGGNMIDGMSALHSANPTRYKLAPSSVAFLSGQSRAANPPVPTVAGTVYECQRGNPGWQAKITIFQNSVNISGWRAPACPIVMDKFCYIDQDANATQYVNAMTALEAAWPTTIFVYITMPLTTDQDYNNVLRNQYNTAVRQYCQLHGRLLYDIADMEAYDPAGNPVTFTYGGQTYQKLYAGYTSDGGHLNTVGSQRIATGWYAVAAAIATAPDCNGNGVPDNLDIARGTSQDLNGNGIPDECEPSTGDMTCDGVVNGKDISPFVLALLNPSGYEAAYPECDLMHADCSGDGTVDTGDIGPFVTRLIGS